MRGDLETEDGIRRRVRERAGEVPERLPRAAREVRSATVNGRDATLTDALSTTVFVLGVERGMELVARMAGVEAVIVDAEGRIYYSSGLEPPQ